MPALSGLVQTYSRFAPALLLPLILAVALGFRLYGIGWDDGYGFHPDERSLYMRADCMFRTLTESPGHQDCIREFPETRPGLPDLPTALNVAESPLNPHWFPLGSLLIYAVVLIRGIFEPLTDLGSLLSMAYIGRSLAVVADVGTVFMVYLLGKRIFDRRAGLLGAALVALTVVSIQSSHFYRPEPFLVFFVAASFWAMLRAVEHRRLRDSLLLGVFVGLTFAMKVSSLPLALPLALGYGYILATNKSGSWEPPSPDKQTRVIVHMVSAAAVAVGVFFITTPYALLDMVTFVADITYQADNVARTAGIVPFTVQYVDTPAFLYELRQTTFWGFGLPLGIAAWGGVVYWLVRESVGALREGRMNIGQAMLLAWALPNFILLGFFETKFLRYIFPIMPFMVLLGAGMLVDLTDRARSLRQAVWAAGNRLQRLLAPTVKYAPHAALGVTVFIVVATAFYAVAFSRVYASPHPAVQASEWINENLPHATNIVTDNHWDEGIPNLHRYGVHGNQIPIYERDSPSKMESMAEMLSRGDWLVFYSNRTYGSVARLPQRYPLSSRYYRLLFSGELGYELTMEFSSHPNLFGVAFVDDPFGRAGVPEPALIKESAPAPVTFNLGYADENVVNYDHPRVLLFQNVGGYSSDRLLGLLLGGPGLRIDSPEEETPLLLDDEDRAAQREGGTWSDIIKRDSWTNAVPILAWLLLVEVIYIAALPLSVFVFRWLPDRGVILARVLGILGVAYVAWLLASLEWVHFSRYSALIGLLVMATLSGLTLAFRWRDFKDFIVSHWRLLAVGEVLFLVAFLAFTAVRWANPDLWHFYRGGEKPMDFAYLNAVLRSTVMPPYDPWFAGGYLNYYYWGQFIVATLVKATGIVPSVAYNLAVPLLFSLTITGAYSIVFNLVTGFKRAAASVGGLSDQPPLEERPAGSVMSWRDAWRRSVPWHGVGAGVLAAAFVAVIGNLGSIGQVVRGGWNTIFHGAPYPSLTFLADFWKSSRMIPVLDDVSPSALTFWIPEKFGSWVDISPHITEFPFFSFLFADLHAHMIAIPFTLLAVALAFNLLLGIRDGAVRRLLPAAVVLAVAVGALWAINSWDYPTFLILSVGSMGLGAYLRQGRLSERAGVFLGAAVLVGLLSVLAFLPFHNNYHPFPTGIVAAKWQTPLLNFLGIHGLFLFIVGSFLVYVGWTPVVMSVRGLFRRLVRASGGSMVDEPAESGPKKSGAGPWTALAGGVALLLFVYTAVTGFWTAAVIVLFIAALLWSVRRILTAERETAPYVVFPLALALLALLVAFGVEFIRVQDDIGRMNTLFKHYLAVWTLLAMASAFLLWRLASQAGLSLRGLKSPWRWRTVWMAAVLLLFVSTMIYPVLGTWHRIGDRFLTDDRTLDGAAYMENAVHWEKDQLLVLNWDYQAIRELQDKVQGSPVILEAWTPQYRWGARYSIYTGLPAVMGWGWHQEQQRMEYRETVVERVSHVDEIYTTSNSQRALDLMERYDVKYIIVGQLEEVYYPASGLEKFAHYEEQGLTEVWYENPEVKVYRALWYN